MNNGNESVEGSDNKEISKNSEEDEKPEELDKDYLSRISDARKSAINTLSNQYLIFNKWILSLASGALVLSLAFIEKIVSNPAPDTIPLLISAWGSFGFCIILTLISFIIDEKAWRKYINVLDGIYTRAIEYNNQPKNRLTTIVNVLSIIAMVGFITGVICLITFSIRNISLISGGLNA